MFNLRTHRAATTVDALSDLHQWPDFSRLKCIVSLSAELIAENASVIRYSVRMFEVHHLTGTIAPSHGVWCFSRSSLEQ